MPKKKMTREEMKKAARIAARNVPKAKKKKEESLVSKVKKKLKKIYGGKKKVKHTPATKSVKAGLKKAGTEFKSDAEKRAEKKKKKY